MKSWPSSEAVKRWASSCETHNRDTDPQWTCDNAASQIGQRLEREGLAARKQVARLQAG